MKIGIIGAGKKGNALTGRFQAPARAVSVQEAVRGNDVVVLAITPKGVPNLPSGLFSDAPLNLPITDTTNYYPRERNGRIDGIEAGLPESEWVERQNGHSVVKSFNMIRATDIVGGATSAGTPGGLAVAVADNDQDPKRTVMQLIDEIGFDAVDAGTIAESWRQQAGSTVYCKGLDADAVRRALSQATPARPIEFRATPNSPGRYEDLV